MQSCCIPNCESHKPGSSKHIAYFRFPLHDEVLLRKWLLEIRQPKWRPKADSHICAMHFRARDIDSNPKRQFLLLKPDATPTIFPKRVYGRLTALELKEQWKPPRDPVDAVANEQIKSPKAEQMDPAKVRMEEQKLKRIVQDSAIPKTPILSSTPSIVQTTPLILTPNLVNSIPTLGPAITSTTTQRFRKILPKIDDNTTKVSDMPTASPKSYIIIIPTFDNTKTTPPPPKNSQLFSNTSKKPGLKITVNRKLTETPLDNNDKSEIIDDNEIHEQEEENKNPDEVVIYSETLKKYVVFTLDPETEEIFVSRRDTRFPSKEKIVRQEKSSFENPVMIDSEINDDNDTKDIEEPVVERIMTVKEVELQNEIKINENTISELTVSTSDNQCETPEQLDNNETQVEEVAQLETEINKQNPENLSKLIDIYEKAQDECTVLRARLLGLHDRHEQEKQIIEKLQNELTTMKQTETYQCSVNANTIEKRKLTMDLHSDEPENKKLLLNDGNKLAITNGQIKSTPSAILNDDYLKEIKGLSNIVQDECGKPLSTVIEDCDIKINNNTPTIHQNNTLEVSVLHDKLLNSDLLQN